MTKRRCISYRILIAVVAFYGVMSACVCADHTASPAAVSVCHHCAGSGVFAAGTQIASHHQCCGMERAPMAVEKVVSQAPAHSDDNVMLQTGAFFSERDAKAISVSTFSHAPPGDVPVYLTTQRFLI